MFDIKVELPFEESELRRIKTFNDESLFEWMVLGLLLPWSGSGHQLH